jgi:hypothetical protein
LILIENFNKEEMAFEVSFVAVFDSERRQSV